MGQCRSVPVVGFFASLIYILLALALGVRGWLEDLPLEAGMLYIVMMIIFGLVVLGLALAFARCE